MSDSTTPNAPAVVVPQIIQELLYRFEADAAPFTCRNVYSAVCAARQKLENPTAQENAGAWAEVLAFGLSGAEHNEKPWGTFFGPIGAGTNGAGETVYFPDVRQADTNIIEHWKQKAHESRAPTFIARYADLVWDLAPLIAKTKREAKFARMAANAYLTLALQTGRDLYDAFSQAERALVLGIQLRDDLVRDRARKTVLDLHTRAVTEDTVHYLAFDILDRQEKSGQTYHERAALVADLETILARVSDCANSNTFDPHETESVANRLLKYYRKTNKAGEAQRLHTAVAKAFEHFGSLGDAMLASMVLQTSMDAYRQAGSQTDADRILRLIETANIETIKHMKRYEHRVEIPAEDIEKFLSTVVLESKEETLGRIAGEFMTSHVRTDKSMRESAKESPLSAMIGRSKIRGDRIVAQIGSLDEDPLGHLIEHANFEIGISTNWLAWSLKRAREKHAYAVSDLVAWANKARLFGDGKILHEGIAAWMADDHLKALHILVPQVEAGFRTLVGRCGRPTTKAHNKQMRQARMVITMGEILYDEETAPALGPHGDDLVLHLRMLYADPRGLNLRNDLAHGLLPIEAGSEGNMLWVMHTMLLLGAWSKPVSEPEVGEAGEKPGQ